MEFSNLPREVAIFLPLARAVVLDVELVPICVLHLPAHVPVPIPTTVSACSGDYAHVFEQ